MNKTLKLGLIGMKKSLWNRKLRGKRRKSKDLHSRREDITSHRVKLEKIRIGTMNVIH